MRKKNDKKKKGLIVAIFVAAIFMAIGYAALQAELTINAVGKIYSDWDVEFTEASCTLTSDYKTLLELECFPETSEYAVGADHLELYDAGITNDGDDNKGTEGFGGIQLDLYTEFASPDDKTVFDIEITNFSSMWDAYLMSIAHENISSNEETNKKTDWILYEFSDNVVANGGSVNNYLDFETPKLETATTVIAAGGTNVLEFTITAKWNPAYKFEAPTNGIPKTQEFENSKPENSALPNYKTETYTQKDTFVMLWEAYAPGTNPWTP